MEEYSDILGAYEDFSENPLYERPEEEFNYNEETIYDEGYEPGFDEPQLKDEVKAFERAGPSGKVAELVFSQGAMGGKKLDFGKLTGDEKFIVKVNAIAANNMNSGNLFGITQDDINKMLEKIQFVPSPNYKNALGYILGYICSNSGEEITRERVNRVFNEILPYLESDSGIKKPDVIRYARMWTIYLK